MNFFSFLFNILLQKCFFTKQMRDIKIKAFEELILTRKPSLSADYWHRLSRFPFFMLENFPSQFSSSFHTFASSFFRIFLNIRTDQVIEHCTLSLIRDVKSMNLFLVSTSAEILLAWIINRWLLLPMMRKKILPEALLNFPISVICKMLLLLSFSWFSIFFCAIGCFAFCCCLYRQKMWFKTISVRFPYFFPPALRQNDSKETQ